MYMIVKEIEEEVHTIEDVIVPYSNINITHANDNKPPFKLILKRTILWIFVVSMIAGLFVL